MIEEIKILADVVDYPVTVAAFVWALRMIQTMHKQTTEQLNRCLQEHYQDKD